MKQPKVLALALSIAAMSSVMAIETVTTKYTEPTGVAMYAYSEESCVEDNGTFDEGMCFFESENELIMDTEGEKVTRVEVNTIGANAHSCSFESKNITEVDGKIIATEATEIWDHQTMTYSPATCVVEVSRSNLGGFSVENNGNCREFCGMRAYLGIINAQ